MRVVADDDVDRRQVHAWRHVEPSRTNDPKAFLSRASPAGKPVGAGEQANKRKTALARHCACPLVRVNRKKSPESCCSRPGGGAVGLCACSRRWIHPITAPLIWRLKRDKGGDSVRVPPLPIPNREVKPHHADGTAKVGE